MAEFTLLLGADLGEPPATFARATSLIAERIGPVTAASRDHWTEPWGFRSEHPFLNRALLVESAMDPALVMRELLRIETELGRVRTTGGGYAPRTLDVDILFIGGTVLDQPGLTVPHPRVHLRTFALGPAADLVPELIHPLLGRTVLELLNQARHGA
ncbi:MAG: 2-amino-4-hydroxy-6-hydroxymethyldihydropteridine diphosphokinase [Flavobacteriales bacterium]|nr:2-amino-4-hydroxy-6-hydroxymethyldihydropteridine diphosphokinase [Flavobacteriales bacterium]